MKVLMSFVAYSLDAFSVQLCLRIEILFVAQQVDPVVTILKFALMIDGMNPSLRLLLSYRTLHIFYVHVTVHRNKFLYDKTN